VYSCCGVCCGQCFWHLLSRYVHVDTVSQINSLAQIKTDVGRTRVSFINWHKSWQILIFCSVRASWFVIAEEIMSFRWFVWQFVGLYVGRIAQRVVDGNIHQVVTRRAVVILANFVVMLHVYWVPESWCKGVWRCLPSVLVASIKVEAGGQLCCLSSVVCGVFYSTLTLSVASDTWPVETWDTFPQSFLPVLPFLTGVPANAGCLVKAVKW